MFTSPDEGTLSASGKSVEVLSTDSKIGVTEEVIEKEGRGCPSLRRGSCMRRSYTLDFKVKTLQLLERLSESEEQMGESCFDERNFKQITRY